jgi:hypothetical protein
MTTLNQPASGLGPWASAVERDTMLFKALILDQMPPWFPTFYGAARALAACPHVRSTPGGTTIYCDSWGPRPEARGLRPGSREVRHV